MTSRTISWQRPHVCISPCRVSISAAACACADPASAVALEVGRTRAGLALAGSIKLCAEFKFKFLVKKYKTM